MISWHIAFGRCRSAFCPEPFTRAFHLNTVADPECARGGGVSYILAEKRGVSFILLNKNA